MDLSGCVPTSTDELFEIGHPGLGPTAMILLYACERSAKEVPDNVRHAPSALIISFAPQRHRPKEDIE
jgi:hypothetical protein